MSDGGPKHVLVISLVSWFVLGVLVSRLETIYEDRFYLKL